MSDPAPARIDVVVNPAAGQPEPILAILERVFAKAGVTWQVSITHEVGDGTRLARRAVEQGADVVVAYGGDGTVMEVANALVGSEVPLAILPGGTGNAVASQLQIPTDLEAAAWLACGQEAAVRQMDVGRCRERFFLLHLSIGFTARQVAQATREMRDRYGLLAYAITGLQLLPESEPLRFTFRLEEETIEFEGVSCLVANVGSLGTYSLSLAPHIRVDDGLLDLVALPDLNLPTLVSLATSLVSSDAEEEQPGFAHWQVRRVTIEADPPQPVLLDGEPLGDTPVSVEIVPQALRVLVPTRPETPPGAGS